MTATCEARSIKRERRTKAATQAIRDALYEILANDHPMTVRQLFYRAVTQGLIPKTEKAYLVTVCRLTALMRKDGSLPYSWLADHGREPRTVSTWSSIGSILESAAGCYRRDVWHDQPYQVQVWLEKDALAGIIGSVTDRYQVPLMVCRGYPSLSFLWSAVEMLKHNDMRSSAHARRDTILLYFGDRDPSGCDIDRSITDNVREMAPNLRFVLERVAVTRDQIDEYSLPTRPTKQSDLRAKNFAGESVELDAFSPEDLKELVKTNIEKYIDRDAYDSTKQRERAERQALWEFIGTYGGDEDNEEDADEEGDTE